MQIALLVLRTKRLAIFLCVCGVWGGWMGEGWLCVCVCVCVCVGGGGGG